MDVNAQTRTESVHRKLTGAELAGERLGPRRGYALWGSKFFARELESVSKVSVIVGSAV